MSTSNLRRNPHFRFSIESTGKKIRYLAENEATGRFVRLGKREYMLVVGSDGTKPMQQVIAEAVRSTPEEDWSSSYLEKSFKWLLQNQLLENEDPTAAPKQSPETGSATDNSTKATSPEPQAANTKRGFDVLSFRVKILSGATIQRALDQPSKLLGLPFAIVASFIFACAMLCGLQQWEMLTSLAGKLFVPESKFWWLFAWLVLKTVHEAGHALTAIRFGGAVREAGLSFFCFTPIPFVDVSDIWRSTSRMHRILCSISGVLAELLVASIAIIFCCFTTSPTLQFACVSIVTLGTISAIAFNANPLMRYDGYYVVSDLLNRPTLWTDATAAMQSRFRSMVSHGGHRFEGNLGLAIYGFSTMISRILMMLGLAWGAITVWEGLGWIAVIFGVFSWYVAPQLRAHALKKKLNTQLKISRRKAAIMATLATASILLAAVIPSPFRRAAPGIVVYSNSQEVRPATPGILFEHLARYGDQVTKGQPLARLLNPKLVDEFELKRIEWEMTRERAVQFTADSKIAEMQSEQAKADSLVRELELLSKQVESLTITAPCDGVYLASNLDRNTGDFITEQNVLGIVADPSKLAIELSVAQHEIERFYTDNASESSDLHIAIPGMPTMHGTVARVSPKATNELKDPVLTATYNGPIAVRQTKTAKDGSKFVTVENRFCVDVDLATNQPPGMQPGQKCHCWPATDHESILAVALAWLHRMIDNEFTSA